jgi:hypothetical protein
MSIRNSNSSTGNSNLWLNWEQSAYTSCSQTSSLLNNASDNVVYLRFNYSIYFPMWKDSNICFRSCPLNSRGKMISGDFFFLSLLVTLIIDNILQDSQKLKTSHRINLSYRATMWSLWAPAAKVTLGWKFSFNEIHFLI